VASLRPIHQQERAALCVTLASLGPARPTLCADWNVGKLAAHLVASERWAGLPLAAFVYPLLRVMPGSLGQRFIRSGQRVGLRQLAAVDRRGWEWSLTRLATGPPTAFRLPWAGPLRLVEDWIHHEDARRANGLAPRPPSPELDDALWRAGMAVARFPDFAYGRDGVEAVRPDGRRFRLGSADPTVSVTGSPGEILLFLAGRTEAAQVDVAGDAAALARLRGALRV
jgi:uncharacterized protein (TIGR03085 family)